MHAHTLVPIGICFWWYENEICSHVVSCYTCWSKFFSSPGTDNKLAVTVESSEVMVSWTCRSHILKWCSAVPLRTMVLTVLIKLGSGHLGHLMCWKLWSHFLLRNIQQSASITVKGTEHLTFQRVCYRDHTELPES